MSTLFYDVIVVGGGIAGSCLAGVLVRAGLGVLVLEKEASFRDRVRGETTWPYGVTDARAMGLDALLADAGAMEISGVRHYTDRSPADPYRWAQDSIHALPEIGFHKKWQCICLPSVREVDPIPSGARPRGSVS